MVLHTGSHRVGGRQEMRGPNLSFPQVVLIHVPLLLLTQVTMLNTTLIFKVYFSFAHDDQQI